MLRRSASIAMGLALAVSACSSSPGGDETSGSVATPSTAAARVTTSVPIAVAPTTTIPEPADDLSQLDRESLVGRWASDRAAAVQRISDGGWGVDDGVLRGPGGMRFDLSSCPDGWTDGGPDGETVPLSWWIEYHGVDPARAEAFLDWLGDDGLVGGKPIELVTGPYGEFDWEMNTAAPDPRVEEQVDRRLATDTANRALAVVGFRDWTATDGFQLLFDEACLPSIGRRSSQPPRPPRDGRLSPSPWIVPSVLVSHETTSLALAELSRVEFTGQRIALLVMDNEFGDTLAEPLLDLAAAGRLDVVAARHDAAAPTIDQEIRLLVESEPAVLIAATAGNPCRLTVAAVAASAPDLPVVLPEFCAAPYLVSDGGPLPDRLLSLRSVVDGTEASVAATELGRAAERSFGSDDFNFGSTAEWASTWQAVQILQIAAELPGGLSRTNIVLAAWSFDGEFPLIEGPVTLSWPDDVVATTAARLHRWDADTGQWSPTDVTVDVEPGE